jgi:natural product biosynthesis luciferase-like monooxygenase protein
MDFSVFFFSADGSTGSRDKYRMLFDCATFADRNGFSAVWTPERHFVDFGGLYPNPAVLSAALAMVTKRIQIRAGSVVLPLHHPARVAEEWAVVDNLSGGRVAISVASGWHPQDFVLADCRRDERKAQMFRNLEIVRALWAGKEATFTTRGGPAHRLRIRPRPLQDELPIWISISGSEETWATAGAIGANVLTGLVNQPFDVLRRHVSVYRDALLRSGHRQEQTTISVMLHTFLGESDERVKSTVRGPMVDYFGTFVDQQVQCLASGAAVSPADKAAVAQLAFEKYYDDLTLLGSPDKCARMVERLSELGVGEIACLVDFGLDRETVLSGLENLSEFQQRYRDDH